MHLPARDPEEEEAIVLQDGDVEFSHLVISQRTVGQLHVDIPGRVGHHHSKLTQDGNVQVADITADPLESQTHNYLSIHLISSRLTLFFFPILILTCEGNSFPTLLSASPVRRPSSAVPAWGPSRLPSVSGGLSIS